MRLPVAVSDAEHRPTQVLFLLPSKPIPQRLPYRRVSLALAVPFSEGQHNSRPPSFRPSARMPQTERLLCLLRPFPIEHRLLRTEDSSLRSSSSRSRSAWPADEPSGSTGAWSGGGGRG